ncbi:Sm-like protein LSM2 [Tanacetum coccineum]|uniref:Sm-like protein LSM2 n=1 Tax=Tanacetum coccineum TaxID=301880 RepID=A0ABQ4Y0K6_9ASTR
MLFFSYFKDLVGREVTVELKNDLAIRGTLHSVDQYLNIKLENTRVVDQDKGVRISQTLENPSLGYFVFYTTTTYPIPPERGIGEVECRHTLPQDKPGPPAGASVQLSVRNCFIRGSVVRYVQLPPEGVDIELLHDATRREARGG